MNLMLNARYVYHSLKEKVAKPGHSTAAPDRTGLEGLFSFPIRYLLEDAPLAGHRSDQFATTYQQPLYPPELGILDALEVSLIAGTTRHVMLRSSLTGQDL